MNNIAINNNTLHLPNIFEMETSMSNCILSENDFFEKFEKDIESFYFGTFKHINYELKLKIFIHSQLLINKSYEYLVNKNEDFDHYIKKWKFNIAEVDKIANNIKLHKEYKPIDLFDIPSENDENMNLFYKLSFSVFFVEKYLLPLLNLCPAAFIDKKYSEENIKKLHQQLFTTFKTEYDKAYIFFKNSF